MKNVGSVEDLLTAQSELLRNMFIAELAIAGVPQREIAKIVRVNLNRVNEIAKSLNKKKKAENGGS